MRGPAVLVAGLVLWAGCGHPPVTRVEFGREASRVCRHSNARARQISASTSGHDASKRRVDVQRAALADLRDLEPPRADRGDVEKWLAVVDQMLDEAERAQSALASGDPVVAASASERAAALDGRARQLGQALGVREPCRMPAPPPAT